MKKLLVMMFSATLLLAGCGDKDETVGEKLDNAIDATKEATSDAYDATKEATADAAEAVSDAVDDETDDTKTH